MAYTDSLGNRVGIYSLGIAPAVSLNAVTSGNGAVLDGLTTRTSVVVFVTGNASVATGAVTAQTSADGVNWVALGSAINVPTTATTTMTTYTSGPYGQFFRVIVSTNVTGSGGKVSASIGVAG
jgi:hypothetical protein